MNSTVRADNIQSIAPFRHSAEIREASETTITGQLPPWLRGTLVRTCPAVFEASRWRASHWFDGLCMIYAFRIGDSSLKFQSRLLESEAASQIAAGPTRLGSFGTENGRSFWQRVIQPVQKISDNTNVNIVEMGPDLVALTEGSRQQRIDAQSLRALGDVPYPHDTLGNAIMSAHPHFDFERGRVLNVATKFGTSGVVAIYEHAPDSRSRKVVGAWRTSRVPYVHTFGLTPANAILLVHPFTVKPIDMLWSNRGYIDHFEWRPSEGTRLVVIERATGAVSECETDPMFVFHTVNAFENGKETILDVLAYPNAEIMEDLRVQRMVKRRPDLRPSLIRIKMQYGRRRAELEKLSDTGFEFPSTNYRRFSGHEYRFAYGAADGPDQDGSYPSAIVKVDTGSGKSNTFSDGDHIFGEPIFVARPGGTDEDDGVLLSVGASQSSEKSSMVVIDAKTMALVASAEVLRAIPLGFHGSFVREHAR